MHNSRIVSKVKPLALCISWLFAAFCYFWQTPPAFAHSFSHTSGTMIASIFSFSGKRPANLGVKDGKLQPCPGSPNCVSSQSTDKEHKIEPLQYNSAPAEAFAKLKAVIEKTDNAKIISEKDNYLYAEFTSALMGFVDDVEFYIDEAAGLIQVRSASRLGQSDLGANRTRIETIRTQFNS
ncbi:MAG: DUF1499 domain-containing protein [Oscillatoria sp. SIO1A7]|nr:DUF1499 domain-containing protein [Oscillatoria sp. SIO1A7]